MNGYRNLLPGFSNLLLGLDSKGFSLAGRQECQKTVGQSGREKFIRVQRAFALVQLREDASAFPVPIRQRHAAQLRIDDRIRPHFLRNGEHPLCNQEAEQVAAGPQVLSLSGLPYEVLDWPDLKEQKRAVQ